MARFLLWSLTLALRGASSMLPFIAGVFSVCGGGSFRVHMDGIPVYVAPVNIVWAVILWQVCDTVVGRLDALQEKKRIVSAVNAAILRERAFPGSE